MSAKREFIIMGWGSAAADVRLETSDSGRSYSWEIRLNAPLRAIDDESDGKLRKRVLSPKGADVRALDTGSLGEWILRRSLVEPVFRDVPKSEVVLHPVELVDDDGLISDDFVFLDVRAFMPIDRDACKADFSIPKNPHASLVKLVKNPLWGPERQPSARIFRVGEFPAIVMIDAELLAELRKATRNIVGPLRDKDDLGDHLCAFSTNSDVPPIKQKPNEAAASAEGFWRLWRGVGGAEERKRALESPIYGYWTAFLVDKGPRDETRRAALAHPHYAALYARFVDGAPRDDTRKSAAGERSSARVYASYVDERVTDVTRKGMMAGGERRSDVDELAKELAALKLKVVPAPPAAKDSPAAKPPATLKTDGLRLATDDSRKGNPMPTHRAPTGEVARELGIFIPRGLELLGLDAGDDPAAIVEAISRFADEVRRGKRKLKKSDPDRTKLKLACVWGEQISRALGWEWATVVYGDDSAPLGLISKNRAHAVFPMQVIERSTSNKGENVTVLLFNMLVGGDLPPASAWSYTPLQ